MSSKSVDFEFAASGDLHLSNSLPHAKPASNGQTDRLVQQMGMLAQMRRIAEDRPIVIAGDLTDKAKIDPVTLVSMIEAMKAGGTWYVLPGNHDAASLTGGRFNVEIFKHLGDRFRYLDGPMDVSPRWRIWCLPFASPEENAETIAAWQREIDAGHSTQHNALLMHNAIVGCKVDGDFRATIGLSASEVCKSFDRVWSGHFHSRQRFGKRGMYFGAPMQHRFSDEGEERGMWIISLHSDGSIAEKFVALDMPRFYTREPGDIPDCARSGDYVRFQASMTAAEWTAAKPAIDASLAQATSRGLVASSKQVPKYQHTSRSTVDAPAEASLTEHVDAYLKRPDVEIDPSLRESIAKIGKEIAATAAGTSKISTSAQVEFISMSISDMFPIAKATIKLSEAGLVFVGGRNEDSDGAANNGAGKTSIYKALTWILYGKTVDGEAPDRVVRRGAKKAKGSIVLRVDGELWTIKRSRANGTTKLSVLNAAGEAIVMQKKDLQEVINAMIGLDFQGFRSTVLYGRSDPSCFAAPSCSDAERKYILHSILGSRIFDAALTEAKLRADAISSELASIDLQIAKVDGRIAEVDPAVADRQISKWDDAHGKALARLRDQLDDIIKSLESAATSGDDEKRRSALATKIEVEESKKERIKEIEAELKLAKAKVDAANRGSRDAASTLARAEAELKEAEKGRRLLRGERCSLCSSPLSEGHAHEHIEAMDTRIQRLKLATDAASAEVKRAQGRLKEAKVKVSSLESTMPKIDLASIRTWSRQIADIDGKEAVRAEIERSKLRTEEAIKAKANERNPHSDMKTQIAERRAALLEERAKLVESTAVLSERLGATKFWIHGFGSSGIPSIVLDGRMQQLTDRTNHYLRILTDGDITGEISTQKTIANGEVRDRIAMTWTIEGNEGVTPSDGQSTKIRVAVDLALMDLAETSTSIDLLLFDEVLDGLDDEGTQRMLDLLVELRARKRTIMVISHAHGMSEAFEAGLLVVKRGKVSVVQEIKS